MHPIVITSIITAALAVAAAFLMWKKNAVEVWQCNSCSQWFDAMGNHWTFRPPNAAFISDTICPKCAHPNKEQSFVLLPGGWDIGSSKTLAEYFGSGDTPTSHTPGADAPTSTNKG